MIELHVPGKRESKFDNVVSNNADRSAIPLGSGFSTSSDVEARNILLKLLNPIS